MSVTTMPEAQAATAAPAMHRRKKSSRDLSAANPNPQREQDALPTLSVSFDDGNEREHLQHIDDGYDNDDKKASIAHQNGGHQQEEEEEGDDEAMDGLAELGDTNSSTSPQKSKMTAAERRDHSRKHSRVHSRNLSVFFPRPGSEAEREADEIRATDNFGRQTPHRIQTSGLAAPNLNYSANSASSYGSSSEDSAFSPTGLSVPSDEYGAPVSPTKSRRGHHRKHSVNHAIFDGAQLQTGAGGGINEVNVNGLPSSSTGASPWSTNSHYETPKSPAANHHDQHQHHHHHHHAHEHHQRDAHHTHMHDHANEKVASAFPSSSSLHTVLSEPLWSSLPASHRPLFVFGLLHFALGASLWVSGQSGDSLAMTGLGYLVVFDALGVVSGCGAEWLGESWRRQSEKSLRSKSEGASHYHATSRPEFLRRPYGAYRVETLLYFVQSIYLLFASVYVCKESIEHALLEGTEEHHEEDDVGLVLPTFMLLLATAVCLFSNLVLHNHAKLVAACGISTAASEAASSSSSSSPLSSRRRGHGRAGSVLVDPKALAGPFLHLISNPFSLTVLFFSAVLAVASILMPPFQVAALDKVLAGMESAAMAYIAWPASKALGKVLLQTAPSAAAPLNVHLHRTIKTIEDHQLVTYVAPPHLWQLTPPTSALTAGAAIGLSASPSNGGGISTSPSKRASSILPGGAGGLMSSASASRTAKHAALVATLKVFVKDEATDEDVLDVTRWAWQLAAPSVGAGAGLKPGETLRGSIRAGELIVEVQREGARDRYFAKAQEKYGGHHDHHHDHHDHHDHDHNHGHAHDHHHHDDHHHDHAHAHAHAHAHDHGHHKEHAGHAHSHQHHEHDHASHSHNHHGHHDHAGHGHALNGHSHSHHETSQQGHSDHHQHSSHSHSHDTLNHYESSHDSQHHQHLHNHSHNHNH